MVGVKARPLFVVEVRLEVGVSVDKVTVRESFVHIRCIQLLEELDYFFKTS